MNRYTQLTPAQFSPLSLQEMMMVPLAKQKQYDSALAEISENKLFNNQYLDVHSDIVNKEIDAMTGDLKGIEDELMSSGDVGSIKKRLVDLATRRKNFLSPQGIGGQAQAVRDQYLKNIEAINKDRTMRPEDKEWYKRNALNQYVQSQKALTDESIASYSDYSGYASRDVINEAIKIASGITIDNDTFVNDSGTVENKKQRSKEFIYKNIMNQLGSDTNLINYLKETGYGNNYMQVLHNAAMNAANQKVVDESHLRGGSGTGSGKGTGGAPLRISSTGDTARIGRTTIDKDVLSAVKNTKEYNNKILEWTQQLTDENLSDSDREAIRLKITGATDIFNMAHLSISEKLKLPKNFSINDLVSEEISNPRFRAVTAQYIDDYIENPSKKYNTVDNGDGTLTISHVPIELKTVKTMDGNQVREIKRPDKAISFVVDSKKLNQYKQYKEEMDKSLQNDSLIPYNQLIIQSQPGKNWTLGNNILKNANDSAVKTLKQTLNLDKIENLQELDKDLAKHFMQTKGNHEFVGISQSETTGEILITINVDVKDKDKAGLPEGADTRLQVPITRMGYDGNIPHAYEDMFQSLKNNLGFEGRKAMDEMMANFKTKNLIVDNKMRTPISYSKGDTKKIKDIMKLQNRNDNKLYQKITRADKLKLISTKEIDFDNRKVMVPPKYAALSMGDQGTLSLGEYIENMARGGYNPTAITKNILENIESGNFYMDEQSLKKIITRNEKGQIVIDESISNYPLMSRHKRNLLNFNVIKPTQ